MTRSEMGQITDAIKDLGKAMEKQTEIFQEILAALVGPEYIDNKLGTAEEDDIDDSSGVYETHVQAEDDIKAQWREDGYPDEITKYFE